MRTQKKTPGYAWEKLVTRESFAATFREQLDTRRQSGEHLTEEALFDEMNDYLFEQVNAYCFPTFDAFRMYRSREQKKKIARTGDGHEGR